MSFGFLHSVAAFFTPKPVPINGEIIETVNECGEKIYIELERNYQMERHRDLETLITKCKRLLSFVEIKDDVHGFEKMAFFVAKVRQAKYRGDDITVLFREYEQIEKNIKGSSNSFQNLSKIEMMG